jgi:hypothetical protein
VAKTFRTITPLYSKIFLSIPFVGDKGPTFGDATILGLMNFRFGNARKILCRYGKGNPCNKQ